MDSLILLLGNGADELLPVWKTFVQELVGSIKNTFLLFCHSFPRSLLSQARVFL